jgi:hypothetical protein
VRVGVEGGEGLGRERTKGSSSACRMRVGTAMRSIHARGGGAVVVVVGRGEAGVEGGDLVVEVAQGAMPVGLRAGSKSAGKEHGLAAIALAAARAGTALVEAVQGRCSASAEGPRSIAGETPTTE